MFSIKNNTKIYKKMIRWQTKNIKLTDFDYRKMESFWYESDR